MKVKSKRILVLLLTCFSLSTYATTYYVSSSGSDSNSGGITDPFKSFNKVVSVMLAGDECIVREGVYRQALRVGKNGSADNPIIFRAMEGEKVIVKATKYVNGWTLYKDNIYRSSVNMGLDEHNQIYYKGELMQIARWPNDTDGDRFTPNEYRVTARGSFSSIPVTDLPSVNLDGAMLWYLGGHGGTSWTRPVTSVTATEINFVAVPEKWPFIPHNPSRFYRKGNPAKGETYQGGGYGGFYLFNTLSLLDQAKEWYYDETTQTAYLKVPGGNKPRYNTVEIANRIDAASISGDYVVVQRIEFFGGRVKLGGDHVVFKNNKVIHGLERTDSETNTKAQITQASVEVTGNNVVLEGNTVEQGSLSGIFVMSFGGSNGDNCRVEKNTVKYFNPLGIHATPIRSTASGAKIVKNLVSHGGRDGVYVIGPNSEVAYNDISRSQLINDDSGVFYTVNENKENKNIDVHHNWIHDGISPYYSNHKAAGIYLDNNSKGFNVHHNVVWNISWDGIRLNWENWDNNMYHNTILNVKKTMGSWVNGYTQKNNRVWNNYSNKLNWLQHVEDPEDPSKKPAFDLKDNIIDEEKILLQDITSRNFMPKEGSVLVDATAIIDGFDKTFYGDSPDAGAYELGGVMWTAGLNAVEDVNATRELSVRVLSKPNSLNFNDLSNPSSISSDVPFKVEVIGLDPSKNYSLFNQLNNLNTSVQVAGFSKKNITGVERVEININWRYFPNNPLTTDTSDTFEWRSNLFEAGKGTKLKETIVNSILYETTLSTDVVHFSKEEIYIYPNPTQGIVNVFGLDSKSAHYTVLDTRGRVLRRSKDFSNLPTGVYFLKIETEQFSLVKKIIVY